MINATDIRLTFPLLCKSHSKTLSSIIILYIIPILIEMDSNIACFCGVIFQSRNIISHAITLNECVNSHKSNLITPEILRNRKL